MGQINHDIKEQFEYFKEMVNNEKTILNSIIILRDKSNNPYWAIGKSIVEHISIDEQIELIVEQSKREEKYGVKLRCKDISQIPIIRFDSDGPAHRNIGMGIPLEKQLVTTPHFNTFDENGHQIAYKNETLLNKDESTAICNDINFGVSMFCIETNSKLKDGEYPNIQFEKAAFDFGEPNQINYDSITFE